LGQGGSGRFVDDELDLGARVVFQLARAVVPVNGFLGVGGEVQAEQFDAGLVVGRANEEFLVQAAGWGSEQRFCTRNPDGGEKLKLGK
jgi:hypothetical protein